jgi:hypothetical protein
MAVPTLLCGNEDFVKMNNNVKAFHGMCTRSDKIKNEFVRKEVNSYSVNEIIDEVYRLFVTEKRQHLRVWVCGSYFRIIGII